MQKLFYMLFACGCLLIGACQSQGGKSGGQTAVITSGDSAQGTPAITFEQATHDFGQITQGEKVEYSFKFTNTGKKDLLILDAVSSCGCTVPEWPKEPLKPGESGYMRVIFDSHGKEGFTEKEISIKANTNPPVVPGPKIQCTIVKATN